MPLLVILLFVRLLIAHSWVEQVSCWNDTEFQKVGYPRGNVPRDSLEFSDESMTYLLPKSGFATISSDDNICRNTQREPGYTSQYPVLRAQRGTSILLRYQENGHATLLSSTPQKITSGIVSIYGTLHGRPDHKFREIHNVWDVSPSRDGGGRKLTVQPFDDGACYGPTGSIIAKERMRKFSPDYGQGPNRWCRNMVELPVDVVGMYTLYWVWDWSDAKKEQFYTTCLDVEVTE